MAINRGDFQVVYEIFPYPECNLHILCGHEFPINLQGPVEDLNGGIFAVTDIGSAFIADPGIWRTYIPGKGRHWTVDDPQKFPSPPFLLTTDRRFRQIFYGEAVVHMNGPIEEDTEDELTRNEIVNLPIIGDKMIGIVGVSSIASHRARLVAYSSEIDFLPERISDLRTGAEDSWLPFGSISQILKNPRSGETHVT